MRMCVWSLIFIGMFGSGAKALGQSTPITAPADLSRKLFGDVFPVTQLYLAYNVGNPTPDHRHAGLDFGAARNARGVIVTPIAGRAVKAVKGGAVLTAGGPYGTVAIFDGTNTVIYLHLTNIRVTNNMSIPPGTIIGYVGATSPQPIAPHLHVEVRRGRQTVAVGPTSGTSTAALTIDPFYYLLR